MSAQDTDLKLLANFFSGYFHEDWMCKAADSAEVIHLYLQTAKTHEVAMLREAIVHFVSQVGSDAELEKKLFSELGCYYQPSVNGQSAREWLVNIVALLLREP